MQVHQLFLCQSCTIRCQVMQPARVLGVYGYMGVSTEYSIEFSIEHSIEHYGRDYGSFHGQGLVFTAASHLALFWPN